MRTSFLGPRVRLLPPPPPPPERAAVFQVVRHCRRVPTQSFQSCCVATAKWCKVFLTSRLFIWRYCGVNILTIRRFYGFISPHLRPVVEAEEDGGEFKLPNTTNFRLRWIQIIQTFTNHGSLRPVAGRNLQKGLRRASLFNQVQCLLHNIHSELLQIGFPRCLNFPVY